MGSTARICSTPFHDNKLNTHPKVSQILSLYIYAFLLFTQWPGATNALKNKPKINEDPKDAMLREYQEEIQKLKELLGNQELGADQGKSLENPISKTQLYLI